MEAEAAVAFGTLDDFVVLLLEIFLLIAARSSCLRPLLFSPVTLGGGRPVGAGEVGAAEEEES